MKFYINPIISIHSISSEQCKSVLVADTKLLEDFDGMIHDQPNFRYVHINSDINIIYDNHEGYFGFTSTWWMTQNSIHDSYKVVAKILKQRYMQMVK